MYASGGSPQRRVPGCLSVCVCGHDHREGQSVCECLCVNVSSALFPPRPGVRVVNVKGYFFMRVSFYFFFFFFF